MTDAIMNYANVALRDYNAIIALEERILDNVSDGTENKRDAFIAALRALAAIKNGVYVAMAHLLMRASAELNIPPEDLILEAFPDSKTFGASLGTVSQMRALALVVIPQMRRRGMSDEEIIKALLIDGALSRANKVIPVMRAASKPSVPLDVAHEAMQRAMDIIVDDSITVEEASTEASMLKRFVTGEKPKGFVSVFDMPNGDIAIFAVVPRGKERGAVNSLLRNAERKSFGPIDIIRFLQSKFKKTGGV